MTLLRSFDKMNSVLNLKTCGVSMSSVSSRMYSFYIRNGVLIAAALAVIVITVKILSLLLSEPPFEADPKLTESILDSWKERIAENIEFKAHLVDAVEELQRLKVAGPEAERSKSNLSLEKLEAGAPGWSAALFKAILEREEKEAAPDTRKLAKTARHLAVLTFLSDAKAARQAYAKAADLDPDAEHVWNVLGWLSREQGALDEATVAYLHGLGLAEKRTDSRAMADYYGILGDIYRNRKMLDQAEEMYQKALKVTTAPALKEIHARHCDNLAEIYKSRGDLDKAEKHYLKALGIAKELEQKESMAKAFGNLGNIYYSKGNLKEAEWHYVKALNIEEALLRKEGIARQYGNLGALYAKRGDLDDAETYLKKSLAVNEDLGRMAAVA